MKEVQTHLRARSSSCSDNEPPSTDDSFLTQRLTNHGIDPITISKPATKPVYSPQALRWVKALHIESTLVAEERFRLQRNNTGGGVVRAMEKSIEGLIKVLIWRVDGAITDREFSQIYFEWLKRRDIQKVLVNVRGQHYLVGEAFTLSVLETYLKDPHTV